MIVAKRLRKTIQKALAENRSKTLAMDRSKGFAEGRVFGRSGGIWSLNLQNRAFDGVTYSRGARYFLCRHLKILFESVK